MCSKVHIHHYYCNYYTEFPLCVVHVHGYVYTLSHSQALPICNYGNETSVYSEIRLDQDTSHCSKSVQNCTSV